MVAWLGTVSRTFPARARHNASPYPVCLVEAGHANSEQLATAAGEMTMKGTARAGQVRGVPGQGQRRADSDASQVTFGPKHRREAIMTSADMAATLTGERMMSKYTGARRRPSRDEIARLAYHLFETHGRLDGRDVDDWLSAEQELLGHRR